MKKWWPILFIVYPIIELWGILIMGDIIGGWNTLMLLIVLGIVGAAAAMYEGKRVMLQAKQQMNYGQIPGRSLVNGICILIGGVLLLFPGFLSDILGLLLLIPFTRRYFEGIILKWIESSMNNGRFMIRRF